VPGCRSPKPRNFRNCLISISYLSVGRARATPILPLSGPLQRTFPKTMPGRRPLIARQPLFSAIQSQPHSRKCIFQGMLAANHAGLAAPSMSWTLQVPRQPASNRPERPSRCPGVPQVIELKPFRNFRGFGRRTPGRPSRRSRFTRCSTNFARKFGLVIAAKCKRCSLSNSNTQTSLTLTLVRAVQLTSAP
jgi:hypothetical protein